MNEANYFIVGLVVALVLIVAYLARRNDLAEDAERDKEELLRQANVELEQRPRVRAGK